MSSTTPTPPPPHSAAGTAASLTERRKAETRMEIARAAAGLFVRQGLRATRAEDVARAAGVAPRTFYRYFAGKEEAVGPLYEAGARRWVEAVRTAPAEVPLPRALEEAVRHTLTPGRGVSADSWRWVRALIRLAGETPSLRGVWAEVCQESERILAEVLTERARAGRVPDGRAGDGGTAAGEAAGSRLPDGSANVAVPVRARFAAAVAGSAVRVALEAWAAGDGPAEGPRGPAALALAHLAALRDFPWEEPAADV